MLTELTINGYRGLDPLSLKNAGRFNLFIGPNNSGKTSILEAIRIFSTTMDYHTILSIISSRGSGFHPNALFISEQLQWLFSGGRKAGTNKATFEGNLKGEKRTITMVMKSYAFPEETLISPSGTVIGSETIISNSPYSRTNQPNEKGMLIGEFGFEFESVQTKAKSDPLMLYSNSPISWEQTPHVEPHVEFIEPSPPRSLEAGIESYDVTVKRGFYDTYIEVLKEIEPQVKGIKMLLTRDRSPHLYVEVENLGLSPLNTQGDGFRRVNYLSASLARCQNGILLIDEFENSVHTSAFSKVVSWLVQMAKKLNVQVFATTHSLECIDTVLSATQKEGEDFSLFKISRGKNGALCQNISLEDLKIFRSEMGLDVRLGK